MNEALRAVAELKAEGIGFGRGGRCEDVYAALRLGDDAVLIADLPRKGRGRASERRGVAVAIGKTCCCSPLSGGGHGKRNGPPQTAILGRVPVRQCTITTDALSFRARSSMQDVVRCVKHSLTRTRYY